MRQNVLDNSTSKRNLTGNRYCSQHIVDVQIITSGTVGAILQWSPILFYSLFGRVVAAVVLQDFLLDGFPHKTDSLVFRDRIMHGHDLDFDINFLYISRRSHNLSLLV